MGVDTFSDAVVRRAVCAALAGIALAAAPAGAQDTVPAPDAAPQVATPTRDSAGTDARKPDPAPTPAPTKDQPPSRYAARTNAGAPPPEPARTPPATTSARHARRPAHTQPSPRPAVSRRAAVPRRRAVPTIASPRPHDERARRLALAGAALLALSLASIGLLRLTLRLGA